MQPPAIRSDMIGATIMHGWLARHMPDVAQNWDLAIDDMTRGFGERIKAMFPPIELVFVGQAPIARTSIERWDLKNVAYLGAGTPTPFSPTPDQLLYYTDANETALAEAAAKGYHTRRVDIRQPADLRQLAGATTLIATGLVHFVPDEGARAMFNGLAQGGFRTFVFNHMQGVSTSESHITGEWDKLGFKLYWRTPAEVEALFSDSWQLDEAVPLSQMYSPNHALYPYFGSGREFYTIYKVSSKLPPRG